MPKDRKRQIARTPVQEAIEALITARFAYLIDEKGYLAGPTDRSFFGTTYLYLGNRIGIDVTVEFNREYGVLVYVIRTQDGELLPNWNTFSTMSRWRTPAVRLLEAAPGVPADFLQRIRDYSHQLDPKVPTSYEPLLSAIAQQLRFSIDYLASLPYDALFPAPA